ECGTGSSGLVPEVSRGPAATTRVGAATPPGTGAETLCERWNEGVCGLKDGVGACSEFEPTDHFTKKEARRTDRFVQFAIVASDEAVQQTWGDDCPYDPDRVGCIHGVSMGGSEMLVE